VITANQAQKHGFRPPETSESWSTRNRVFLSESFISVALEGV